MKKVEVRTRLVNRDWKAHPTIYEFMVGDGKPEAVLLSIKNAVHGFGYEKMSDLEKLHVIHELVKGYDKATTDEYRRFSKKADKTG